MGNSYSLRWPSGIDANDVFTMTGANGGEYYGMRLQVANIMDQNWHFMHLRWMLLPAMNKFILGAQSHLNLRSNAADANWKTLHKDDFTNAPDLSTPLSLRAAAGSATGSEQTAEVKEVEDADEDAEDAAV